MPRSPLLLVLALLPACKTSQHPDADDYDTPEQHGAALYDTYCDFCHGAQGEGYVSDNANALANQDFLRLASDEFLASSIVHGRPGTPMSAWGTSMAGPLSDEDVEHLVAYIRSSSCVLASRTSPLSRTKRSTPRLRSSHDAK